MCDPDGSEMLIQRSKVSDLAIAAWHDNHAVTDSIVVAPHAARLDSIC